MVLDENSYVLSAFINQSNWQIFIATYAIGETPLTQFLKNSAQFAVSAGIPVWQRPAHWFVLHGGTFWYFSIVVARRRRPLTTCNNRVHSQMSQKVAIHRQLKPMYTLELAVCCCYSLCQHKSYFLPQYEQVAITASAIGVNFGAIKVEWIKLWKQFHSRYLLIFTQVRQSEKISNNSFRRSLTVNDPLSSGPASYIIHQHIWYNCIQWHFASKLPIEYP